MLTLVEVRAFKRRFTDITGQTLEDWSAFEELRQDRRHEEPTALAECLDKCISAELYRLLEGGIYRPESIRDLAILQASIRLFSPPPGLLAAITKEFLPPDPIPGLNKALAAAYVAGVRRGKENTTERH